MMQDLARFIGEIARPLAIIATSFAAAWATITISYKVEDGNDGAIFIAGVFAGLGTLYLGKAWELVKARRSAADEEIARTTGASPMPQPVEVVNRPDEPVPVEPRP